MRNLAGRPSQNQSPSVDIFGIPELVRTLLDTPANSYGDACRLGAQAAEAFVSILGAHPHLAGMGRLLAIARYIETHDRAHGIAIGFFAKVDEFLLRGAQRDAALIRALHSLSAPSDVHDVPVRHPLPGTLANRSTRRLLKSHRLGGK